MIGMMVISVCMPQSRFRGFVPCSVCGISEEHDCSRSLCSWFEEDSHIDHCWSASFGLHNLPLWSIHCVHGRGRHRSDCGVSDSLCFQHGARFYRLLPLSVGFLSVSLPLWHFLHLVALHLCSLRCPGNLPLFGLYCVRCATDCGRKGQSGVGCGWLCFWSASSVPGYHQSIPISVIIPLGY